MTSMSPKTLATSATIALAAVVGGSLTACDGDPDSGGLPDVVDYNWDVRPILSDNCFQCHGPDGDAREAGLRLDLEAAAHAELPNWSGHFAIVAGEPEASELIRRLRATDPEERMPPLSTHKTLSAVEIATLERWIEQGGEYRRHWAFVAPSPVEPPAVPAGLGDDLPGGLNASTGTAPNGIDGFVFARGAAAGLTPEPEADRETLIHRATFTLTGLPATPAEVEAFVSDAAPNAWEKVIDRLLTSQAYGERMATEWLDAARFADSDGYLDDAYQRLLYPWRDWVIDAFNRNLPYDEFGTWQIAGDLLEGATKEQRLASGFGRLHRRSAENGIIDEEYRVEYVIDRTDTVGTAFLGLSVGCARCHDHKFDPISHVDYYSLAAFFNSTDDAGYYPQLKWNTGPTMLLTDGATDAEIADLEAAVEARSRVYDDTVRRAEARAVERADALLASGDALATVLRATQAAEVAYYPFETMVEDDASATAYRRLSGIEPSKPMAFAPAATEGLRPVVLQSPIIAPGVAGNAFYFDANNKGFIDKADGIGYFEHTEPFSVDFWVYLDKAYEEAALLNHSDHLRYGSGGWSFDLEANRIVVRLVHAYPREQIIVASADSLDRGWHRVTMTYDGSARAAGLDLFIDGRAAALEVRRDRLTQSMLPLGQEFAGLDDFLGIAFGKRWQMSPLEGGAIDEIRIYDRRLAPLEVLVQHARAASSVNAGDGPVASDAAAAGDDPAAGDGAEALSVALLAEHLVALDPDVTAAFAELRDARRALNDLLTSLPEVMTMGDTEHPRPSYVLERGIYDQHAEPVEPRGLTQIFPYADDLPKNRLGLARWLFDPRHPLTARAYVNRLWQMHFGRGIVRTSEEFGTQGEAPTHPHLLDWLAAEFVASGWNVKAMNKLIAMSATFRRAADAGEAARAIDPENIWLARGAARRLPAEMIRDNALAISGLLNPAVGGPSVFPYQPADIWKSVNVYGRLDSYPAPEDVPDDHHRRSLYTLIRRGVPAPSLSIFDFPRRHTSTVRRPTSSTPLQALVLLNDPQYVEASRELAARVMRESAETAGRLDSIFRLAARRGAAPRELDLIAQFYERELRYFGESPDAAAAYLATGIVPADPLLDPLELAALASTANVVLNTPDSYMLR